MALNNPRGKKDSKTNTPKKNPNGRPTDYKPEYCQQIIDFMACGDSLTQFAAHIGVHRDTIYHWTTLFPEFSDALKKATTKCEAWWESAGKQGMRTMGGFNAAVWIFSMKARFKWQDQTKVVLEADVKTEDKKEERLEQVKRLLESEFGK